MKTSACRGYPPAEISPDICGRCKEHADFEDEDGELRPPRDERALQAFIAKMEADEGGEQ